MNIVNKSVWQRLQKADKPIWLYGTGNGADKILDVLDSLCVKAQGVFASDGFVRNRSFRGFPVLSYEKAKNISPDMIILTAFGSEREDVRENVLRLMRGQELYAPDVPLFGVGLFTPEYIEKHREEAEKVYSLLADGKSKSVYENIINAKLSGDLSYLFSSETNARSEYEILSLKDNEVFMDLGAYRGDTVFEFLSFVNGYEKIYAAEPDERTFKKLCSNTAGLNIECINAAVSNKDEKLFMLSNKGRGACVCESGKELTGVTVDSILGGKRVSFIKMDVEGHEAFAIDGAKNSIKMYKPKLKIAAYHRNEDMFSIPLKVLDIRSDYKVYIRHRPSIPAWNTDFIFI